jgi:hypothetical protein
MGIVVLVILIGLIPAAIASSKGRSFVLWWIYGMALFIVALPHALIMGPAGTKRTCPHCGEYMLATATVCPHCSREVAASRRANLDSDPAANDVDRNIIVLQKARDGDGAAWSKLAVGKRLKITRTNSDAPVWIVESEDGLIASVTGADAKRIAFFADTDGKPRGTVADIGKTDEEGIYRVGFILSAVPAGG